jgi:hypothetical protein
MFLCAHQVVSQKITIFHVVYVKNIVAKIARDTFVIFFEIVHAHIECEYVRKRYVRILFTFWNTFLDEGSRCTWIKSEFPLT